MGKGVIGMDTADESIMEELLEGFQVLSELPQLLQILYIRLDEIAGRQIKIIKAQENRIGAERVQMFLDATFTQVRKWKNDLPDMGKDQGVKLINDFEKEDLSHLERLIPEEYGGTKESEIHLMHPEYQQIDNAYKQQKLN